MEENIQIRNIRGPWARIQEAAKFQSNHGWISQPRPITGCIGWPGHWNNFSLTRPHRNHHPCIVQYALSACAAGSPMEWTIGGPYPTLPSPICIVCPPAACPLVLVYYYEGPLASLIGC